MELNNNNAKFVHEALKKGQRVDGRGIYDYRSLNIKCGPELGSVEVQLGETRVHAKTTIEVTRPYPDRPSEGMFAVSAEISPIGGLEFDSRQITDQEVLITRLLEKILQTSRAVDTESLCIAVGEQVWRVRTDLHYLDYSGNYIDAGVIAVLASLKHFRRPEVTKTGEDVVIHDVKERAPVPLNLNHIPVCISFSYFEGDLVVLDPSYLEEKFEAGSISVAVNANRELCCINKAGGIALNTEAIMLCTMVAVEKSRELIDAISAATSATTTLK